MNYLVTGCAGFIGYYVSKALLKTGATVVGVDNLNSYYDIELKHSRLELLNKFDRFKFEKIDISNKNKIFEVFQMYTPDIVINLAAQAGVRYSIVNPDAYIESNIIGFFNILEACRRYPIKHLVYASSSSVYGLNVVVPFSTNHNVDHPISLYAATKKSNELMAHSYSQLYDIPTTGLRFFTVYGPWGRPDMAYFSFTKDIIQGNVIKIFNHGKMERDFTYIDDIVDGVLKVVENPPNRNKDWSDAGDKISSSFAPYKIYNIGNNKPEALMKLVQILELELGKKAKFEYHDMQPGDVLSTYADISDLEYCFDFKPKTELENGLRQFVKWYLEYYKVS